MSRRSPSSCLLEAASLVALALLASPVCADHGKAYGFSCHNVSSSNSWPGTPGENSDEEALCEKTATMSCPNEIVFKRFERGITLACLDQPYRADCSSALALPFEQAYGKGLVGFLYCIFLIYCFLGIAIISDIFMEAIEVITAKTRRIPVAHNAYKGGGTGKSGKDEESGPDDYIEVQVWNETVANLTLMALGSSAPEIMLAVVEQYSNMVYGLNPPIAGKLGAMTIVGSASFNLLCITGIVVSSVGDEPKKINMVTVFSVTAFFSLLAYIWLVVVLQPDPSFDPHLYGGEVGVIEAHEAFITLALLPLMVFLAWAADNECWMKKDGDEDNDGGDNDGREQRTHYKYVHTVNGANGTEVREVVQLNGIKLDDGEINASQASEVAAKQDRVAEDAALQIARKNAKEPTRMEYRMNAARKLGGKKRVLLLTPGDKQDPSNVDEQEAGISHADQRESTLSFAQSQYECMENDGHIDVIVNRTGATKSTCWVEYETEDVTATGGEDYEMPDSGARIMFEPGETSKNIRIVIIDDDEPETDETFLVKLMKCGPEGACKLGHQQATTVTIVDDDKPGTFGFSSAAMEIDQEHGELEVVVQRKNGSAGKATVDYIVADGTANSEDHFFPDNGTLTFENGEIRKSFTVFLRDPADNVNGDDSLSNKSSKRRHSLADDAELNLKIQLGNPWASVKVKDASGRETSLSAEVDPKLGSATVVVVDKAGFGSILAKVNRMLETKFGNHYGTGSWGEQFSSAVTIGGDCDEDGNEEEPVASDYFFHFLSINWKVLFALVPPTEFCGGWLTFWVSIAFIGGLTYVVGETAKLFGCAVGLTEPVIAISFVALGTSLPDTFASMTAAEEGKYADAAIGNVTGSNSVNVFLGLGLPWTMAWIYFWAKGERFLVFVGDTSYSVTVFSILAIICISMLYLRRFALGAELGGSQPIRGMTSITLVFMWVLYVVLSALKSQESAAKVY